MVRCRRGPGGLYEVGHPNARRLWTYTFIWYDGHNPDNRYSRQRGLFRGDVATVVAVLVGIGLHRVADCVTDPNTVVGALSDGALHDSAVDAQPNANPVDREPDANTQANTNTNTNVPEAHTHPDDHQAESQPVSHPAAGRTAAGPPFRHPSPRLDHRGEPARQ